MSGSAEPQPMEGAEPDDRQSAGVSSPDDQREATFSRSAQGYDPKAVHAVLEEVAAWIDEDERKVTGAIVQGKKYDEVGERISKVLLAAEEAAAKLRGEAHQYLERARADAEERLRNAELQAQARADEILAEATVSAERLTEAAEQQHRSVQQALAELLARRDEITAGALQLSDALAAAIDSVRSLDALDRHKEEESQPSATGSPDRLLLDDDGPESVAERNRLARAHLAPAVSEGLGRVAQRDRGGDHDPGSQT